MAGTLTISTLSDGTNSTSATNCIQGSAKAWVNYNGSTPAISASYNISSVTRNSAGNYTLNFTNAFSDTKYCTLINSTLDTSGSYVQFSGMLSTTGTPSLKSTTQVTVVTTNNSIAATDTQQLSVAIFR
jgi:hypothetical protein